MNDNEEARITDIPSKGVEHMIESLLVDRYGRPFSGDDFELQFINGHDVEAASSPLGFLLERFEFAETQAVSCEVCGVMLASRVDFMRRHRLQCGWAESA
jgi:hypothetical protein